MEYNDFSLLDDYGQIAKAYFDNMKTNGYVFVRLEEVDKKKLKQAQKLADVLFLSVKNYEKIKPYLKSGEKQFLQQLASLSLSQCESIKRIYNVDTQSVAKKTSLEKLVSNEAKILKDLFELLFLEQDENFAILKNMIFERLELLQKE